MTIAIAIPAIISISLLLSFLITATSPIIILFDKTKYTSDYVRSAKSHIISAGFILMTVIFYAFDISFSNHIANTIVLIATIVCFGRLSLFSQQMKQKLLVVSAGRFSMLGLLIVTPFILIEQASEGNSSRLVSIGNSMYCKRSSYGFVTSDSGTTLEIFKRYLIIDRRLFKQQDSDVYPEGNIPAPVTWIETIKSCQDSLK